VDPKLSNRQGIRTDAKFVVRLEDAMQDEDFGLFRFFNLPLM
jgi:hypothetical protein